jgi:hypothetical protein
LAQGLLLKLLSWGSVPLHCHLLLLLLLLLLHLRLLTAAQLQ